MLFEKLPEVSKCCFCIPLKYGPIFIALFYIIINIVAIFDSPVLVCYVGINNDKCEFQAVLTYFNIYHRVLIFLFIAPSVFLIVGVCLNKRSFVTCFMYCIFIAIVAEVVSDVVVVTVSAYMAHCGIGRVSYVTCIVATIANVILFIYFITVVKSFRTSISERTSLDISNRETSKSSILLVDGRRISVNTKDLDIRDIKPKNDTRTSEK